MDKRTFLKSSALVLMGMCLGVLVMFLYNRYEEGLLKNARSMNQPDEPIYQLRNKVWEYGDTNAYYKLSLAIIDNDYAAYSLFWPLYMANKYDYGQAYYDVYFFLEDTYRQSYGDSSLYKMDKMTRRLALQYLKLGAGKNNSACIQTIQELKDKKYPEEWLHFQNY